MGGASLFGLILALLEYRHHFQRQTQRQALFKTKRKNPRASIIPRRAVPRAQALRTAPETARASSAQTDLPSVQEQTASVLSLVVTEPQSLSQDLPPSLPGEEEASFPQAKEELVPSALSNTGREEDAIISVTTPHAPTNGIEAHPMDALFVEQTSVAQLQSSDRTPRGPADHVLYLARDFDLSEVQRVLDLWQMAPHTDTEESQEAENLLGRWTSQDGTLIEVLHDKDGTPCIEIRGPMAEELAEFLPQDLPVFPIPQRTNLV